MVGLCGSSRAKPIGPALSTYACLPRSSRPFRLAPAEDANSPAPVSTSTLGPSSAVKVSIASARATANPASTLLWTSGRLSVIKVTGPRCSMSKFDMNPSLHLTMLPVSPGVATGRRLNGSEGGRQRKCGARGGRAYRHRRHRKVDGWIRTADQLAGERFSGALHKHPAMAFDVLGTIALPILVGLDLAQDRCAPLLCPPVVLVHVIDVDQHAVNDVGYGGPLLRRFAFRPMPPRGLVVRRRRGQHDDAFPRLHLAVAEPTVLAQHPGPFLET